MELLKHLHSILRWILLIVLIASIAKAYLGMKGNRVFSAEDNKLGLFTILFMHLQVLIGLVLYFSGPLGIKNIESMGGMGEVMKNSYSRFFAVEHITMMLLALVLIQIGRIKSKKASTDVAKHKAVFWYFIIGLLLILISIPWPFRPGFEINGWF